jgi:hypothetical protein
MQNLGHQARPSSVPSDNCVSKETGASSEATLIFGADLSKTSLEPGSCGKAV